MIKQVIIVRKDLNMRKGKIAAQVAHASMKVFFDRMIFEYLSWDEYEGGLSYIDYKQFTPEMLKWMKELFTKIVVGIDSLEELMQLKDLADEFEIPNALIEDAGFTEFKSACPICKGSGTIADMTTHAAWKICDNCSGTGIIHHPTITCLAIGPDESKKIDKITGSLKLI